jgi:putative glutamine amidotransferase
MVRIGVVMGSKPSTFSKDPHYAIEIRYFQALEKAGAIAIPITYSNIQEQLKNVDGILLPGGDFDSPACYYVENDKPKYNDEGIWFDADFAIGSYALEHNIPLLGICAGMQQLAILLGCKLRMGLESHREKDNKKLAHNILIESNTHMHNIFGKKEVAVNSIHREGVAIINEDTTIVSAKAEDGIIEAIESKNHKFAIGVQWHPECLAINDNLEQLKIFEYFIEKCKK